MSHLLRLQRAFARARIDLRHENGVYTVRNATADATILLPASLPLERNAVEQLLAFASVQTPQGEPAACAACATPDFHPGAIAPVGAIVATPPDVVIPAAIDTDINCGMRLVTTGLPLARAAARKSELVARLKAVLLQNQRDVPTTTQAFKALFDAGPLAFIDRLRPQGLWAAVDRGHLAVRDAEGGAVDRRGPRGLQAHRAHDRRPGRGTPHRHGGPAAAVADIQGVERPLGLAVCWHPAVPGDGTFESAPVRPP
jgi:tRNA-splicing ligase RtcB (3'-phosphate/5'-hydroxy nucleic acid ligase)